MNIAICDDCREDALHLTAYLPGHNVRIYPNARQLLTDIRQNQLRFDLYLLDIFIEDDMDGIELARRLREWDEQAVLCFISTSDAFYREAYDLYAVQYLLKPVQQPQIEQLLARTAKQAARERSQALTFKQRGQAGRIPYGEILYISSREHTLSITCKDGTIHSYTGKLDELEKKLDGKIFFRCHQSFLVNLYQMDRMEGNEFFAASHRIPISRRYYPQAKLRYQEILFEEVD